MIDNKNIAKMLKKLINFIISLLKLAFFGIYISSSIVLFIPFNTATYNQYTYNNSTVYILLKVI